MEGGHNDLRGMSHEGAGVQTAAPSTMDHILNGESSARAFPSLGPLPKLQHPAAFVGMHDFPGNNMQAAKADAFGCQSVVNAAAPSSVIPLGTQWPGSNATSTTSAPQGLQIGGLNAGGVSSQSLGTSSHGIQSAPSPSALTQNHSGVGGATQAQQLLGLQPSVLGYLQYQAAYQQLLGLQMAQQQQTNQQPGHNPPQQQAPDMMNARWMQPAQHQQHQESQQQNMSSQQPVGFWGRSASEMGGHMGGGMGAQPGPSLLAMQGGGGGGGAVMNPHLMGDGVQMQQHTASLQSLAGLPGNGAMERPTRTQSADSVLPSAPGHKSNVELVFPRRGRKSGNDADRRTHEPIQITMETMMGLFHLPLVQAASRLGLSPTAIKSVCRRLGIRKWPFRSLSAKSKWRNRKRGDKAEGSNDSPLAAVGSSGGGTESRGGLSSDDGEDDEGAEGAAVGAAANGLSLLSAAAAEEELQAQPNMQRMGI